MATRSARRAGLEGRRPRGIDEELYRFIKRDATYRPMLQEIEEGLRTGEIDSEYEAFGALVDEAAVSFERDERFEVTDDIKEATVSRLSNDYFDKRYTARGVGYMRNPERKVIAISKDRYRASADERRRYGGNIVTEFYVFYADEDREAGKTKVITGYGKSAADRKRDAIEKFKAMQTKTNPKRKANPGKRHMACGDLSKKRCDQLNDVYESARDRGYSKKRASQQARGVVRKQVAKDKHKTKNPGRIRAAYKEPRVWLEATSGQGETRALVIQDGEIMEVIAIRDGASDASWAKARKAAEKSAMQYARKAGQKTKPKWMLSQRANPPGGGTVNDHDVRELILWIDNSEPLYRMWQAIVKNLWKFKHKGSYDHDRAIDGFEHLANAAAKSYNREIERSKAAGYGRFSVATRRAVAKAFADSFEDNDRDEASLDPKRANPRRRNPDGPSTTPQIRMLAARLAAGG